MTRASGRTASSADWPLALFTALAGTGAGLLLAPLASLAAGRPATAAAPLARPALALLAVGLAVSLTHLGRPLRAALAARRAGRSRLSAEVVLALATLAAAGAEVAWPASRAIALGGSLSAVLFLLSLGAVYALPGQHAWRGPAAVAPLSTALPLAVLAFAAGDAAPTGAWRAAAATLLAADLALFAWRARRLASPPFGHRPAHPAAFARRRAVLALRVGLVNVAPALLALAGQPLAATTTLAAGIACDRASFYGLAVRHTTEGEIEAVEDAITT